MNRWEEEAGPAASFLPTSAKGKSWTATSSASTTASGTTSKRVRLGSVHLLARARGCVRAASPFFSNRGKLLPLWFSRGSQWTLRAKPGAGLDMVFVCFCFLVLLFFFFLGAMWVCLFLGDPPKCVFVWLLFFNQSLNPPKKGYPQKDTPMYLIAPLFAPERLHPNGLTGS